MSGFWEDWKRGAKYLLIYLQGGITLGVIFFFIPILWAFGGHSKDATMGAAAGVGLIISVLLGIILISIHEGRMFFKGYIIGALITLLPFGLLILALPMITSRGPIGLTLLITGLVFSIYQGIMAVCDPDEHALLGRLWRDGFSTGIPGLFRHNKSATTSIDSGVTTDNDMDTENLRRTPKKKHVSSVSKRLKHASLLLHSPPAADKTSNIPNPTGLTYKTSDGHIVRSKAEMLIDNWLISHNIQHYYEKQIPNTQFFCDFYLPEPYDMYVEYWGRLDNPGYNEHAQKKIRKYEELKLNWVGIIDSDIQNLDNALSEKILMNTTGKEETDEIEEHKEENFWE